MIRSKILFSILCITALSSSCKKGPGDGGTSTIKGKVYAMDYNGSGQLQGQFYAPEERVYLIFGDNDFYGMDTRTSYDGSYEFPYLLKGNYTVFAYSNCDTCASKTMAVKITTDVTENHSTVELSDLVINK